MEIKIEDLIMMIGQQTIQIKMMEQELMITKQADKPQEKELAR